MKWISFSAIVKFIASRSFAITLNYVINIFNRSAMPLFYDEILFSNEHPMQFNSKNFIQNSTKSIYKSQWFDWDEGRATDFKHWHVDIFTEIFSMWELLQEKFAISNEFAEMIFNNKHFTFLIFNNEHFTSIWWLLKFNEFNSFNYFLSAVDLLQNK